MGYEVKFASNVRKMLKKLPNNIAIRIMKKIRQINDNPFRYLEHYEGEFYKLRIGDYRALIDVNFERKMLIIKVLDKRGRIYKR